MTAKPLTEAQRIILDRISGANGFCTSWASRGTGLTVAQTYRVMRQLQARGLVETATANGGGFWRLVSNSTGEHHG
jgi:Fe2+ or Zn2+ uptake regulation protein